MPSFKYVIELSDQDKVELLDIVKKGNRPARTILLAVSAFQTAEFPSCSHCEDCWNRGLL